MSPLASCRPLFALCSSLREQKNRHVCGQIQVCTQMVPSSVLFGRPVFPLRYSPWSIHNPQISFLGSHMLLAISSSHARLACNSWEWRVFRQLGKRLGTIFCHSTVSVMRQDDCATLDLSNSSCIQSIKDVIFEPIPSHSATPLDVMASRALIPLPYDDRTIAATSREATGGLHLPV